MQKTAKLPTNGGRQPERLPAEFRFDVDEVYVLHCVQKTTEKTSKFGCGSRRQAVPRGLE
jgi:hypothetical protein